MSNGAGTPSNALTALGSAAGSAQRQPPPAQPVPDPKVTAAFTLGWQVAELYRPGFDSRPPANADDLPTLERLSPEEQLTIALLQIDAGVARVSPALAVVNLTSPDTAELSTAFAPPPDDGARREAVHAIHIALLSALTAAELRLGRAYGLGRALADTCRHHRRLDAGARVRHAAHRAVAVVARRSGLGSASACRQERQPVTRAMGGRGACHSRR